MRHRGPDSARVVRFQMPNNLWLSAAFVRLAIQDPRPDADQPFTKDHITVLFNGEIYNAPELRAGLISRHSTEFRTSSDTEVILELYRIHSHDFTSFLRGMFAIVIVDFLAESLILFRDRFGIKPLFTTQPSSDTFIFSSDIGSIRSISPTPLQINTRFLAKRLLCDPFVAFDDETAFVGVRQIRAGSYITIRPPQTITRDYYSIRKTIPASPPSDDVIRSTLSSAVTEHLTSDVAVSATLSGGFDSSLIARLSAETSPSFSHLFTLQQRDGLGGFKDDYRFARVMAHHLRRVRPGIVLHSVPTSPAITLPDIDRFVRVLSSPLYDSRILVWHRLYSATQSLGIKVILNGQGADELWYGYYPRIWNWISILYHNPLTPNRIRQYFTTSFRHSAAAPFANPDVLSISDEIFESLGHHILQQTFPHDPGRPLTLFFAETVLPALLHYEDAIGMLNSVEVRVPFLDHRIVELAMSLSGEQHLLHTRNGKDRLKRAVGDWVPPIIAKRQKSPLPKPDAEIAPYYDLFFLNKDAILSCPLIRDLFETNALHALRPDDQSRSFYGGQSEFLLQLVSLWRFAESFS